MNWKRRQIYSFILLSSFCSFCRRRRQCCEMLANSHSNSFLFLLFTAQPRRRHHNKVCHHITFEVCVLHALAERRHQQRDSSVSSSSISPQPPVPPFLATLVSNQYHQPCDKTLNIFHNFQHNFLFSLFFIPQTRALFCPLLAHFLSNKRRRRWCLLFFVLRREKHGAQ